MRWLLVLALALLSPRLAVAEPLRFVPGAQKPEDLARIPGTQFLIASGFAPGAGLKLVDTRGEALTLWYTGAPAQIAPVHHAYPACPGPVNPSLFNARGLPLRKAGEGLFTLHVVNHGGRESIEVFTVDARPLVPALSWKGCIPMPEGQVANSVATYSDGTVLATVLTHPGTSITDFVLGKITGGVWQKAPDEIEFSLLPGTELPGNNGLETARDDSGFFVIAFGRHSVFAYDRRDTRQPLRETVFSEFMPDNIHFDGDRLLAAGMRYDEPACGGRRKIVAGVADPMLCHRGWVVAEVDPKSGAVATVAYGEPDPVFSGVSAAVIVDGELWLGSFQASGMAHRRLPAPSPAP